MRIGEHGIRIGVYEIRIGAHGIGIGVHEIRIGEHGIRIGVHEIRIWLHEIRIGVHEIRIGVYEIRIGVHGIRIGVHEIRIGEHGIRIGVHEIRIGLHEIRIGVHEIRIGVHEIRIGVHGIRIGVHEIRIGVHQITIGRNLKKYFCFSRIYDNNNNNVNNNNNCSDKWTKGQESWWQFSRPYIPLKCLWCHRRWKWIRWHGFKSRTTLSAFSIELIPLKKACMQLFFLRLWVNSRADNSSWRRRKTLKLHLKIDLLSHPACSRNTIDRLYVSRKAEEREPTRIEDSRIHQSEQMNTILKSKKKV